MYLYERGDGRFKHCWSRPYAGFEPKYDGQPLQGQVGKCSSKINDTRAQELLDDGIEVRDDRNDEHPSCIYNVFEGVPYEAVPTQYDKSYHGYPWQGRMPKWVLKELRTRAWNEGFRDTFEKWVETYGNRR